MKISDITVNKDIIFVLTNGRRIISYNSHNNHYGFENSEVKSIRIEQDMGSTWLFAEVDYVSD